MTKNIIFAILGIIIIAVLSFIFYSPGEKTGVVATIRNINEQTSFFNIKAEFPQFQNVDQAFNQKITDLIENNIKEFKKASQENWQARKDTATPEYPVGDNPEVPFDFIATWKSDQINNKYISFSVPIYYFSGGANGITQMYSFNYDVKNKKEISVQDLLNSEVLLAKVAELAKANILIQYQDKGDPVDQFITDTVAEGTSAKYDNYKVFTFNADSVTFYFQKYQVGPGAAGEFNFMVFNRMLGDTKISYID